MSQPHAPSLPLPLQGSPEEIAEQGRQMADFIESPAFQTLAAAVRAYQGSRDALLMGMSPTSDGARYADVVGEMRGVAKIEPIIRGVVESGKQAEAEIRTVEEGGSS